MQSKTGEIYDGKVTGITNFGAFVRLSNGESGMVHISEVASSYVKDIKDHLTEGQDVKVKVLSVNENNKISLSIKQAAEKEEKKDRNEQKNYRSNNSVPRENKRSSNPPVYKSSANSQSAPMSFEEMMAKFKQESDEKISVLKKTTDFKGNNRRSK